MAFDAMSGTKKKMKEGKNKHNIFVHTIYIKKNHLNKTIQNGIYHK